MDSESENGEKKRASISNILSKHVASAYQQEIISLNELKNQEIINSLDSEKFYDKYLNNGAYFKAQQEMEKQRREKERRKEETKKEELRQLRLLDQALEKSQQR